MIRTRPRWQFGYSAFSRFSYSSRPYCSGLMSQRSWMALGWRQKKPARCVWPFRCVDLRLIARSASALNGRLEILLLARSTNARAEEPCRLRGTLLCSFHLISVFFSPVHVFHSLTAADTGCLPGYMPWAELCGLRIVLSRIHLWPTCSALLECFA